MATDWRYRLILIVHINANTADNRTAFATAFVDNGSGETLENERLMFGSTVRLALAASPTVHRAYGINTAVQASMRDALLAVLAQVDAPLPAAQKSVYYGLANVNGAMFQGQSYNDGECFYANRAEDSDFIGSVLTPAMILSRLSLVVLP